MEFRAGDAGSRARRRGPGRDIAVVLAVKLLALGLIYALFFGPAQRPAMDAQRVLEALTGPFPTHSGSIEVRP